MNYNFVISIDPAGIGSNGLIIRNEKTKEIIYKETFYSNCPVEAKNHFLAFFKKLNLQSKNILVFCENFFLSNQKITNPLATAKLIGMLGVIVVEVMGWQFLTYEPSEKRTITFSYKGNMKFTEHEKDAWKGLKVYEKKLCSARS